jgi:heptosyltransferase III
MFFLAHFYIKILQKPKKILVIVQRSNGDVFLSASLINQLYENYNAPLIDLLVNDDTLSIASLIPCINKIHTFSYSEKKNNRWLQEKKIFSKIFRKYDLSINLTASDRSVFYSLISGTKSISAIEKNNRKSWWKKIFLSQYYFFDSSQHILKNNLQSLILLKINFKTTLASIVPSKNAVSSILKKLKHIKVNDFVIFHPTAQYSYKIYPKNLRDILISYISKLDIAVIITGGVSFIDLEIKKEIPNIPNVFDFIGETSLEEFFALSNLSLGYIGMDTLNMHIAAAQNKRIFAIFGPTKLKMWAPWSSNLELIILNDKPIQTYGNITIFQADLSCVACGNAGCDNNHGYSECLDNINPKVVYEEFKNWHQSSKASNQLL